MNPVKTLIPQHGLWFPSRFYFSLFGLFGVAVAVAVAVAEAVAATVE